MCDAWRTDFHFDFLLLLVMPYRCTRHPNTGVKERNISLVLLTAQRDIAFVHAVAVVIVLLFFHHPLSILSAFYLPLSVSGPFHPGNKRRRPKIPACNNRECLCVLLPQSLQCEANPPAGLQQGSTITRQQTEALIVPRVESKPPAPDWHLIYSA